MKSGLLITLRLLVKKRLFTVITLLNLTVGFSACLLMLKYVRYERNFDKFYPGVEDIYRISYERYQNGNLDFHSARTMSALAPAIKRDFPTVEEAIRGCYEECLIYRKEDQKFLNNQRVLWADDGFLEIFRIKLVEGDPKTALKEPYTAIISETQSKKLFGDLNPMGKTFWHNEGLIFTVTGIFKDIPQNTHLELDFIYSYITLQDWPFGKPAGNWGGKWLYTYIRAGRSFDPGSFESALNASVDTYMPDLESKNIKVKFDLQPVKDIHLDSNLENEITINNDRKTISVLIVVAIMIILITWINFINLIVAQNKDRLHELGTRKILGESRKTLFIQSILMVLVFNILAFGLSIIILKLTVPVFNQLFDLAGSDVIYSDNYFWPVLAFLFLTGACLAGIYPSMLNARADSSQIIGSSPSNPSRRTDFRKILVFIQFTLSAILIFNTLVLTRQVNFMLSRDLFFNKNKVLILNAPETWCQTPDSVKSSYVNRLMGLLVGYPEIETISACKFAPGSETMGYLNNLSVLNKENVSEDASMAINTIDHEYFKTLEIELLGGRGFSEDWKVDRNNLIINESGMNQLGIDDPESAVNMLLTNGNREFRIVGVVKDHHHLGIKNPIKPMVYIHRYAYDFGYLLIKTHGDTRTAIDRIQKHWEEEFPLALFNYRFLEDFYNLQYENEFRLRKSIAFFAIVAIFLACSGLFGLLKYSLNNRVKEISIRRTLGASIYTVFSKLSVEFLSIIFLSMVLAFIVSLFTANRWLQDFPYRTTINLWVFVLSSLIIILASTFTIAWQVFRAASVNPVLGLRDE